PLPPEEPAGQNPPDGAIIYYHLKENVSGPVTLEILDAKGGLVRRYSSDDKPERISEGAIPAYWIRPPQVLSAYAGSHRFIWDLHYPPPPGPRRLPMTAIYRDTPSEPHGPWVMPGEYVVRLVAGDKTSEQRMTVKMDPRVKTPDAELKLQVDLSMQCYEGAKQARTALTEVRQFRAKLRDTKSDTSAELDRKAAALEGAERRRGERPADGPREPTFGRLAGDFEHLLSVLQAADVAP